MAESQQQILAEIRAKMAEIERGGHALKGGAVERGGASLAASSRRPSHPSGEALDDRLGRTEEAAFASKRKGGRASDGESALDQRAAMRKIERLCSVREQASAELRARLIRDGFAEEVAAAAVERAMACGLVDDARYADVLVRSRLAAGKGCAGIARELSAQGIDPGSVEAFREAEQEGSDAEVDRALALLERRPPRAKNARDAAFRRLVGKGFSSSVAASAARRWWEGARDA